VGPDLSPKTFQSAPAIIHRLPRARAFALVPVLPADRADALAILTANHPHGECQQRYLAQHLLYRQPAAFVIADFYSGLAGFLLVSGRRFLRRHIYKIEMLLDRKSHRFEAAVADGVHYHLQVSLDAYFTERTVQQPRNASCMKRRRLLGIAIEIDLARRNFHIETNISQLEFLEA